MANVTAPAPLIRSPENAFRVMDWMQRNRRHIIYDADFVPAIHLPLCYNVQDSALFVDDLRNPFSC